MKNVIENRQNPDTIMRALKDRKIEVGTRVKIWLATGLSLVGNVHSTEWSHVTLEEVCIKDAGLQDPASCTAITAPWAAVSIEQIMTVAPASKIEQ